jgi:hypothetical protein
MAHEHLIGEGLPHRERRRPLRNSLSRALRKSRAKQVPPELACEQTMEIPPVPRA